MSKWVRAFYFPNCTTKFLGRHVIWTGGKGDYLNMISVAGFRIILVIVIVNKVYEKGAKGVKFYLLIRFLDIFGRISRLASFLFGRFLYDFAFGMRSPCRFVWSFPFLEGAIGL